MIIINKYFKSILILLNIIFIVSTICLIFYLFNSNIIPIKYIVIYIIIILVNSLLYIIPNRIIKYISIIIFILLTIINITTFYYTYNTNKLISNINAESKTRSLSNEKINDNLVFNILLSGIDTSGSIDTVSRSDVNIVMTVNSKTSEVLLTTLQRDMLVSLHNREGLKDKLTHAGIYGIDTSLKTIEDFLQTTIPYYIRLNFDSFINIIDMLDGIDINNDISFQGNTRYFSQGIIHLTSNEALEYVRERKKMPAGDWTRGEHQQEIIKAVIKKVSSNKSILTNYNKLINILDNTIQTNISEEIIRKCIHNQLENMPNWKIEKYTVLGSGYGYEKTYSMPKTNLYVTYPDEDSRYEASRLINGMLNNISYQELIVATK